MNALYFFGILIFYVFLSALIAFLLYHEALIASILLEILVYLPSSFVTLAAISKMICFFTSLESDSCLKILGFRYVCFLLVVLSIVVSSISIHLFMYCLSSAYEIWRVC